jgi:hypothetical protein
MFLAGIGPPQRTSPTRNRAAAALLPAQYPDLGYVVGPAGIAVPLI